MRVLPAAGALFLSLSLGAAPPRPRLVVMISVDQGSADLMQRWGGEFRGALGSLAREGVAFTQAYQAHGFTETGPGHSVLLSGRHPAHTGITENRWIDRTTGRKVYCVEDASVRTLGKESGLGSSPVYFFGSTLGGWLKEQVPGSRVFSVAGKDRAAILMAGPKADGVYWFESAAGFTTSTYYAPKLPAWLEGHNAELLRHLRQDDLWWTPAAPLEGQAIAGHWTINGLPFTSRLPRLVNGAGMGMGGAAWDRWRATPFFDEAVLNAATALVENERVGQGPATDLLILGLSATDYVGHAFGNAGPEMLDHLRRLDARLGDFLARLRQRVPEAWVVLSADHGAADFPERLAEQGHPAKRLDSKAWLDALRARLTERFQLQGDPVRVGSTPGQLYLHDGVLGAIGATRADMLKAVAEEVRAMPEVVEVGLGGDPVSNAAPDRLTLRERLALSYVPVRSGDLLVAFKPLVIFDGPPEDWVATHGSPYDYDRRVPLIFAGPWKAEKRGEAVRTVDLAATLAEQLGLRPTEPLDGRALSLKPAPSSKKGR